MGTIEVLAASPATWLQDLGRPGFAHVGVGCAGAADRGAHALANRLVGNPAEDATIEATLGGLRFRPDATVVIALTGAPAPMTVDGQLVDHCAPVHVSPGSEVALGMPSAGLRSYLAVAGGFDVEPVLGSRSWDSLAKLGPSPVQAGDSLPIGAHPTHDPVVGHAPVRLPDNSMLEVRIMPGPREEWVEMDDLFDRTWEVSSRSDRIAVRLEGEPTRRTPAFTERELLSEGTVTGSVQVPAGGRPVIFLADHPVTGGYPVVGVIHPDDVDLVAQGRPGQPLRFVPDQGL